MVVLSQNDKCFDKQNIDHKYSLTTEQEHLCWLLLIDKDYGIENYNWYQITLVFAYRIQPSANNYAK